MKLHDIQAFVNTWRQFAKVRKLGKPTVLAHDHLFTLIWKSEKRTFRVDDDWTEDDMQKLVTTLRRW